MNYNRRLQTYFNKHYGEYKDEVEWYVDPAPNQWKFKIPSLGLIILLVCNDHGAVSKAWTKIEQHQ